MTGRQSTGRLGEAEAARFLEGKGYKVLETNFRCRYGEIDIVARDGAAIVFVEVKTRGTGLFGRAIESVDLRKQRKIALAAHFYMEEHRLSDAALRFDVVGVEMRGGKPSFELIRDAFEAPDLG